jgi:hypothetical protein
VISAPRLSFLWNAAMGLFGVAFWLYGVLTLIFPAVFAPWGFVLAILAVPFPGVGLRGSRVSGDGSVHRWILLSFHGNHGTERMA